ncbi:MAG: hypothetical protein IPK32_24740 [Verrucomicrobiaceae bacterium]|nr:hypothetical protein [Verrucomicrobiaceae bacterium]
MTSNTLQEIYRPTESRLQTAEMLTAQLRSLLSVGLQFGVSLGRMTSLMSDAVRERLPLLVADGYASPDEGLTALLEARGGCVEVEKARHLFRKPQGVTRQAMTQQIRNGMVLAYRSGGGDYLVPVWQFRPEGGVWEGLAEVVTAIHEKLDATSPLTVFAFLLQAHPLTGGQPPLDALRAGRLPEVLKAIDADAR